MFSPWNVSLERSLFMCAHLVCKFLSSMPTCHMWVWTTKGFVCHAVDKQPNQTLEIPNNFAKNWRNFSFVPTNNNTEIISHAIMPSLLSRLLKMLTFNWHCERRGWLDGCKQLTATLHINYSHFPKREINFYRAVPWSRAKEQYQTIESYFPQMFCRLQVVNSNWKTMYDTYFSILNRRAISFSKLERVIAL